jgi:UDP-glucuronate 4-epimerase
MALFVFTKAILEGEPIRVFNGGSYTRDFTYVDDTVEGVIRASDQISAPDPKWSSAAPDPATSNAPYRIFNIGNSAPVMLSDYIAAIEAATGCKAIQDMLPLQEPGDVPGTFADVSELQRALDYRPKTSVTDGLRAFVGWYSRYCRV